MRSEDFWNCICEKLNYRFFAGVACPGFNKLYKKMGICPMDYIPAANEEIALGLVLGASIAGTKSAILIDVRYLNDITNKINLFEKYGLSFLILAYESITISKPTIKTLYVKSDDEVVKVLTKADSYNSPCAVIFKEGVLE